MLPVDPTSGRSRGFVTIRREHAVAPVAALHEANWAEVERFLRDLDGTDVLVLTGCLREGVSSTPHLLELLRRPDLPQTLKQHLARLRAQVAALDARRPPL